jgi:hypothetical protein
MRVGVPGTEYASREDDDIGGQYVEVEALPGVVVGRRGEREF